MAPTKKNKRNPKRDVHAFKALLRQLLGRGGDRRGSGGPPVIPSSAELATLVNARLERMKSEKKKVTEDTVEKWRASYVDRAPRGDHAYALAEVLEQLQVFDRSGKQKQAFWRALAVPERALSPDIDVHNAFTSAWEKLSGSLSNQDPKQEHDVNDLLLATTCLMSQHIFELDFPKLLKAQGRIVIYLYWDLRPLPEALNMHDTITEELIGAHETFTEAVQDGVSVDIVFGTYGKKSEGCMDFDVGDIITKYKSIRENPRRENGRVNFWQWDGRLPLKGVAGLTAQDLTPYFWSHLYPDGHTIGWEMIRHPELVAGRLPTNATTFASRLPPPIVRDQLQKLGIHWSQRKAWLVTPGEPIGTTS